jgi:hypothetical protein
MHGWWRSPAPGIESGDERRLSMRIWDLAPADLCDRHLLGEHAELHAVWSVLTEGKTGYSRHPETLRWRGKLKALYLKHEEIVAEMSSRGCNHASPLEPSLATGSGTQDEFVDTPAEQLERLRRKSCGCPRDVGEA